MYEMSVKSICEKIWELEAKHGLLHKDIQGVKVWQFSRFLIYSEIAQKTGVFTTFHTTKDSLKDKILAFPFYFYNAIMKNPLSGSYTKDILVFDHPRKVPLDGEYIDIYTKYLLDEFDECEYDVIENPYLNKHFTKSKKNRKYLDRLLLFSHINRTIFKIKFTNSELKWISELELELYTYFNVHIDLNKIFMACIQQFKYDYKYFNQLFQKRKVKKVFIVVSYVAYNKALVAAAKANNIEVIEIQHGTISPYHLGYNFPNCEHELDYFPDKFYSFGNYWNEIVDFPIDKKNVILYGFPYMNTRKAKYKDIKKKEKQILFISQGAIGKELARFAYDAAQILKDYSIVYKLHPGEYDRWEKEYKELVLANQLDNFEIIDNNKKELYSYFAESEYLVGVFSTAIYEGLAFNCKTILVDLSGIEYMKYLVEKEIVVMVEGIDDLKDRIEHFKSNDYDENYFFA